MTFIHDIMIWHGLDKLEDGFTYRWADDNKPAQNLKFSGHSTTNCTAFWTIDKSIMIERCTVFCLHFLCEIR
ncbi:hypothetical protein Bpfe_019503 [Biomphalaria pfeifferi]|uniref:C-type lectin domain-containing protein n=1 Tax=Biomphalaria pfeifferi TaxID=112525 RepID=A0AAD8BAG7_BIOPF|nr:hypothetical protein Bpfe_019503 [Biomphalaria pfeifferi]